MKAFSIVLITFLCINSAYAQKLICTSTSIPAKKIEFEKTSNLVTGISYIRAFTHAFAGTVELGSFEEIYYLYDQSGDYYEFTLNKFTIPTSNHCRARVCNPLPPINSPQYKMGKLKVIETTNQEELNVEYFKCL